MSPPQPLPEPPQRGFNVPAKFIELTQSVILHRDPKRFFTLYRLLWRLRSDHDLLLRASDPDVAQIIAMANTVHREQRRCRNLTPLS